MPSLDEISKQTVKEMMMYGSNPIDTVLRTPDDRFEGIKDFPFSPNYTFAQSHTPMTGEPIRIHYVDEGPKDSREIVLCMHGEPSWGYLYRHMIPVFVKAGMRVICPDLVGFGRSDKPSKREDYTYERMVDWMSEVVVNLRLRNITLFAQDWGGLIGLRIAARYPERFARIAIGNTGLPVGSGVSDAFLNWAYDVSQRLPRWDILMQSATCRTLSTEELAAYDAPFPTEAHRVASRVLPHLVPCTPEHPSCEENKAALRRVYSNWSKPFITLWGGADPIFDSKVASKYWYDLVPGAKHQNHVVYDDANHFLQEDRGVDIATAVVQFINETPGSTSKL